MNILVSNRTDRDYPIIMDELQAILYPYIAKYNISTEFNRRFFEKTVQSVVSKYGLLVDFDYNDLTRHINIIIKKDDQYADRTNDF